MACDIRLNVVGTEVGWADKRENGGGRKLDILTSKGRQSVCECSQLYRCIVPVRGFWGYVETTLDTDLRAKLFEGGDGG